MPNIIRQAPTARNPEIRDRTSTKFHPPVSPTSPQILGFHQTFTRLEYSAKNPDPEMKEPDAAHRDCSKNGSCPGRPA